MKKNKNKKRNWEMIPFIIVMNIYKICIVTITLQVKDMYGKNLSH